jgi:hypothetical protein
MAKWFIKDLLKEDDRNLNEEVMGNEVESLVGGYPQTHF